MDRTVLVGPVYPFRGGISHYTTFLYDVLREKGNNVLLVSFSRQYPRWIFPGPSDRDSSKTPLQVASARYWIDSLNPLSWINAFVHIRRFSPDRLIMQWWTSYWGPVWLVLLGLNKAFLKSRVTFVCHNVVPHDSRIGEIWMTKRVLHYAEHCVVHSETEARRLRAILPSMPVSVVQMPPFDVFNQYRTTGAEARAQLGLPEDRPIILFFGIVRPYKGLEDLIRAMPSVRDEVPEALLMVAGEFWDDRRVYETLIVDAGVEDVVRIDDRYIPDEEVGLYFSAASLLVLPYRRASASAALQAARSFGVPIVAADAAYIESDGNPVQIDWVPSYDPAGLAAAICARLKMPPTSGQPQTSTASHQADRAWHRVADAVMHNP